MSTCIDLGHGHTLRYTGWHPDRSLNPQLEGIPDVEKFGAIIGHQRPDNGRYCEGAITFDSEVARKLVPERGLWQVLSWDPLTISPSLLCKGAVDNLPPCGDHGYIQGGLWVLV